MLGDRQCGVNRGLSTIDRWSICDCKKMDRFREMKGEYEEKGRGRVETVTCGSPWLVDDEVKIEAAISSKRRKRVPMSIGYSKREG